MTGCAIFLRRSFMINLPPHTQHSEVLSVYDLDARVETKNFALEMTSGLPTRGGKYWNLLFGAIVEPNNLRETV